MSFPPDVEITAGSPNPDEERAIHEAILVLWRADQAKAARKSGGLGGWRALARSEAAGAPAPRSWRASGGLMQPGTLIARRVGRGDTR